MYLASTYCSLIDNLSCVIDLGYIKLPIIVVVSCMPNDEGCWIDQ